VENGFVRPGASAAITADGPNWSLGLLDPTAIEKSTEETLELEDGITARCGKAAPVRRDGMEPPENMWGIVREVQKGRRRVVGWASYRSVDRYDSLIQPEGIKRGLTNYMKHPVMLLGHEYDASKVLPLGGMREVRAEKDGLWVEGEVSAAHPQADHVLGLAEEGLLAWSIGFMIPEGGVRDPNEEEIRTYGKGLKRVITEVEILEISLVSVPANRDTMARLRSLMFQARDLDIPAWEDGIRQLKEAARGLRGASRRAVKERLVKMQELMQMLGLELAACMDEYGEGSDVEGNPEDEDLGDGEEPRPAEGPAKEGEAFELALRRLKETFRLS
jgi:HK97 family phage prohead protease